MDLSTVGGIRWNIGAHNKEGNRRSIDITTSRGIYIKVNGKDKDGYAKQEVFRGNVFENVIGNKEQSCSELKLNINGLKTEDIGGAHSQIVQGDKSVNIGGLYSETVTKEKQCKFGKRTTTIVTGDDELEVMKGDIKESITTFGKRETKIKLGNIEQDIIKGDCKTSIKIGNYKLDIKTGKIEIKTGVGTIKVSGTSIDIEAKAQVNIKSPLVKVGKGAPIGGAVTGLPGKPSHMCYVTGAPCKGSLKVGIA